MSKRNENIEELKKRAKDLEDMIFNKSTEDVIRDIQVKKGDGILPVSKGTRPLDYEVLKRDADNKASEIVESVILLYLPPEFISKHEYIFQKMEIDKLTVSSLIFQMKTAEHAIKKLLEEIDNGSTRDRTFEVLSSLQKSKMEIVKHLAQFMVVMENNYKNLKADYYSSVEQPKQEEDTDSEEVQVSSGAKFRGTKSLMTAVDQYLEEEKKRREEQSNFEELERTEGTNTPGERKE